MLPFDGEIKLHITPSLRDLHWLWSWGAHRFQVHHAGLSMPAQSSRSSLSVRSFPTCRQLQPPTSSFIVIIVATDPIHTTHYSRRPCLSVARSCLWVSLWHVVTSAATLAVSRIDSKLYQFSRSFSRWLMLIHRLVV